MAVITVFRQVGCKGRYIAEELARALGYHFSDYRVAERLLLQHGFAQAPKVYQSVPDFWDHFTRKALERDQVNSMLRSVTLAQAQHGERGDVGARLFRGPAGPVRRRQRARESAASFEDRTGHARQAVDRGTRPSLSCAKRMISSPISPARRTASRLTSPACSTWCIDTGKVDPDAAVRFLVEVAGSLPSRTNGGPTAAGLQVDRVVADAVSEEFRRLEHLRAQGYEIR